MIKKTLATLLCVILLVPAGVFADTHTSTATKETVSGTKERVTAAGIAGKVNCGTRRGGAFQRALSEYGDRLGDAALSGIADGVSGRGAVGDALGDILRGGAIGDIARGLGDDASDFLGDYAGGFVSDQISGACGDSSLGQRICGRIGSAVGDFVGDQVERIGGQLISQGLEQLGISQLGGLMGGFGGLLGGGEIKTKEDALRRTTKDTLKETSLDRRNSDTQIAKVCDADPLTRSLAEGQAKAAQAKVVEVAAEQLEDPAVARETARTSAKEAYIESIADPEEKRLATRLATQQGSQGTRASCGTGVFEQLFNDANCNVKAAQVFSNIGKAAAQGETSYGQLKEATYSPQGICTDGPNKGTRNQPELCPTPGHYRITLPGDDVKNLSQKAQQRIFDIDADAIGEAADDLVADLIDEIFTVAEDELESGLQRLVSRRVSGSEGRSDGSYADRLAGVRSSVATTDEGREYLSSNLANSIAIESTFQSFSNEAITDVSVIIGVFEQIKSCYANLALTSNPNITPEEARIRSENASSTVNSILRPQLVSFQENFEASQGVVSDLGILLDEAQTATNATELNATAESYDGLVAVGLLRSDSDLQFFVDDVRQYLASLDLAREDANAQLAQCQQYSAPPFPIPIPPTN
ncbi:hypothetical protein K2P56_03995 [Patescibacteria group bacterium]|nr:hypothetical protein [Patescibacteria group bacterium]